MTGPVTTEALDYVRDLIRQSLKVGAPGVAEPAREAIVRSIFLKIDGKVIQPLLSDKAAAEAALQQVTAERDEARAKQRDMHRRAQKAESFRERHRGGVRYSLSRRWEDRQARRRAEASLATATSELARLRAEGEAKDRAMKEADEALAPFARCAEVGLPYSFTGADFVAAHEARTALARAATAREG